MGFYHDAEKAFLGSGDHVLMKNPVEILRRGELFLARRHATIVDVTHDATSGKYMALLNWLIPTSTLCQYTHSRIDDIIQEDAERSFVEYPPELVHSNLATWINCDEVQEITFAVDKSTIDKGTYAHCLGMSNIFVVARRYESGANKVVKAENCPDFPSFPDHFSAGRRAMETVEKIQKAIRKNIGRTSSSQRLSYAESIPLTSCEWNWFSEKLAGIPTHDKDGYTTLHVQRKIGIRECVKQESAKKLIRVDTDAKMRMLQCLLGTSITMSVRGSPPKAPSTVNKNHESAKRMYPYHSVNALLSLIPVEEEAGEVVQFPKSRGIDLHFDPVLCRARVSCRYRQMKATDDRVLSFLGIGNRDLPEAMDTDEASDTEEDMLVDEGGEFAYSNAIFLIDTIGHDDPTKLVAAVTESDNESYKVGSTYKFDVDHARDLVRNYLTM